MTSPSERAGRCRGSRRSPRPETGLPGPSRPEQGGWPPPTPPRAAPPSAERGCAWSTRRRPTSAPDVRPSDRSTTPDRSVPAPHSRHESTSALPPDRKSPHHPLNAGRIRTPRTGCIYACPMAEYHVGMSGWTYEPWRGQFYPKGLRQADELEYASSQVNSIELNGSFYSL